LRANLSEKLLKRIGERNRIEITGILIYLQNLKKYDHDVKNTDHTFTVPKKKCNTINEKKHFKKI
jgi:hypothetical protein